MGKLNRREGSIIPRPKTVLSRRESSVIRKAKTVAYLRVSTDGQDLEKNKLDIFQLVNTKNFGTVEFVKEKVSGKVSWRERKIKIILDDLKKDDNLIVSELSRLGRSTLDILEILKIAEDKGINVYAVKGNWSLDGTLGSKFLGTFLAMASELERDLLSARTKEALRALKAKGVKLGRPKGPGKSKLDQYRPEIEALLKNGSTQVFIAKRYGTTMPNLCNWIKKNKIDKSPISSEKSEAKKV